MFKKIILFVILILGLVSNQVIVKGTGNTDTGTSIKEVDGTNGTKKESISHGTCYYSEGASLSSFLKGCKPSKVVGNSNMQVEKGFKQKINNWIKNISLILGVIAVGSLVYGGLIMQFSAGEDEKIKKGKEIIKWALIGFFLLISASGIVYVVINVMFGLGE